MPLRDYHERFASTYDSFYADRDVLADARYAAALLGLGAGPARRQTVLDIGCGCGSHVLAFASLGFDATGIDKSPAMIARATAKPVPAGAAKVRFVAEQFPQFCAALNGHTFDGMVSIFQVFNCMGSPGEMLEHLRLVRDKLAIGGRFLIDLWNGAAVFAEDPRAGEARFPCVDDPSQEIVRTTTPHLDRINQRCTLYYRIATIERATGTKFDAFESLHEITFFTPLHYRHLFELAGLRVLDEFKRGCPGTAITERDWYISYLVDRAS